MVYYYYCVLNKPLSDAFWHKNRNFYLATFRYTIIILVIQTEQTDRNGYEENCLRENCVEWKWKEYILINKQMSSGIYTINSNSNVACI